MYIRFCTLVVLISMHSFGFAVHHAETPQATLVLNNEFKPVEKISKREHLPVYASKLNNLRKAGSCSQEETENIIALLKNVTLKRTKKLQSFELLTIEKICPNAPERQRPTPRNLAPNPRVCVNLMTRYPQEIS